jgi:hypothetical protein
MSDTPWLTATVGIRPTASQEEVAAKLSDVFGFPLHLERTGRYEEFPAYYAEALGLTVALLGPPAPEYDIRDNPGQDFVLQIDSCVRPLGRTRDVDISMHIAAPQTDTPSA